MNPIYAIIGGCLFASFFFSIFLFGPDIVNHIKQWRFKRNGKAT